MWRTSCSSIPRSRWRASSAWPDDASAEVVAFVSLRPGGQATPAEITEFARERLAANKYPRDVTILDAVPLTSVGKLDRKALRARVRGGNR